MSGTPAEPPDKFFVIGDKSDTDKRFYINGSSGHVGINKIPTTDDTLCVNGNVKSDTLTVNASATIKDLTVTDTAGFSDISSNNATIGNGTFGFSGDDDNMGIQHKNLLVDGTKYAIKQTNGGKTSVNSTSNILFCNNNTTKMIIENTGNVGIGTDSPNYTLDVCGNIYANENINANGSIFIHGSKLHLDNSINDPSGEIAIVMKDKDATHHARALLVDKDDPNILQINYEQDFGSTIINGNVGINTSTPSEKLEVNGNVSILDNKSLIFNDNNNTSYNIKLDDNQDLIFKKNDTERMKINQTGLLLTSQGSNANNNVELQTTSNGRTNKIIFSHRNNDTGEGENYIDFKVNNNSKMIIKDNGNVGIGTTSPAHELDVFGNINIRAPVFSATSGNDQDLGSITFRNNFRIGRNQGTSAAIKCTTKNDSFDDNGSLAFCTGNGASDATVKMIVNQDGKVGIGNTSPSYKLHVKGDAMIEDGYTLYCGSGNPNNSSYMSNVKPKAAFNGYIYTKAIINYDETGSGPAAIVFGTDNDYGTDKTDKISLITLGATRLFIEDNGHVGIGTTSPSERLTINENTNNNPCLGVRNGNSSNGYNRAQIAFGYDGTNLYQHFIQTRHNGGGTSGNAIDFYVCDTTRNNSITSGVTHTMSLNGGNVGIGVTNPIGKLHIVESTGTVPTANNGNVGTIILDHENNMGASSIVFRSKKNRGSDFGYIKYQDDYANNTSKERSLLTIGTENDGAGGYVDNISLMPKGYVGINTTTPSYQLDVNGDIRSNRDVYVERYLRLHSNSNRLYYDTSNYITNQELSYLDGVTSNIQSQIDNIPIPSAAITTGAKGTINRNKGSWRELNWNHTDAVYGEISGGNTVFSMINTFNMSGVSRAPFVWFHGRIRKQSNGYKEIKSSADFDHAYNLKVCNLDEGKMELDTYFVGDLFWTKSYTQSDDRIKHNEKHIINAIEIIRQLNPIKYDKTRVAYDADYQGELHYPSIKEAGFIAQDVLKIPELECFVKKDNFPVFKHNETQQISIHVLDYNSIFIYSVAALQELDVIVEKQKDSIENQNNEIQLLKNEIKAQKEQIENLNIQRQQEKDALQASHDSLQTELTELKNLLKSKGIID